MFRDAVYKRIKGTLLRKPAMAKLYLYPEEVPFPLLHGVVFLRHNNHSNITLPHRNVKCWLKCIWGAKLISLKIGTIYWNEPMILGRTNRNQTEEIRAINLFPAVDKYICFPKFVFGTRLFYCIVVYCSCPAGTPPTFDYSACAPAMYLKIYMYHVHVIHVHDKFILSI